MSKFSWGKQPAKVSGLKDWREHDATQTWSDAGESERLLASFVPQVQKVIADNVREGVAEYAASGEFSLTSRDGGQWIDFRIWNDHAAIVATANLRDLINAAIAQAFPQLGANPNAQECVSHLAALGKDLNKALATTPAQRQPSAQGQGGQVAAGPRRVASMAG
jgi:hypothetical protein